LATAAEDEQATQLQRGSEIDAQACMASSLKRIRGDLIHSRSLLLAYEVDASQTQWAPMFSMNWRPGHFARRDRIELLTLA
jgi:hypothetical protein